VNEGDLPLSTINDPARLTEGSLGLLRSTGRSALVLDYLSKLPGLNSLGVARLIPDSSEFLFIDKPDFWRHHATNGIGSERGDRSVLGWR
jgi:hypothetical protein